MKEAVGYIGLDTPVELISAAGFDPVRIVAQPSSQALPQYAEGLGHPLLRGLAAALLDGPFAEVSRLIIAPTPSAYGALYVFLRELQRCGELDGREICLFDLNRGEAEAMGAHRLAAVQGLKAWLEGWSGPIGEDALASAIRAANGRRALLRKVEALRRERRVSGVEALAAHGAGEAVIRALIEERRGAPILPGRPTIYSGSETAGQEAYRRLEARGALIVGDDQDAGSRAIGLDVPEDGDLLAALAERYFRRDPVPAKGSIEARVRYLVGLAERQGAERVVFDIAPFDHPPAWEAPTLIETLNGRGIETEVLGGG